MHYSRLIIALSIALLIPAAAEPSALPRLPAPLMFHRAAAFDGTLVVLGGNDQSTGGLNEQVALFDPKTGRWTQNKLPFEPSAILLPAVAGSSLYVLDPFTPALRRYEPNKDKWTLLTPPSSGARNNPSLVGFKGKLYLIGGYQLKSEHCVEVYDPVTDRWEPGPPLPDFENEDHFHLTAVRGDHLHVVGHYFEGKSHWAFDGERWTAKAEAPMACGWKSGSLEAVGGKLMLFERPLKSKATDAVEPVVHVYDPGGDSWKPSGKLPASFPMMFGASATVAGKIHFFGGVPAFSQVLLYDPASKSWQSSK